MSFHHRQNQRPVFAGELTATGGAGAGGTTMAPATTAAGAQENVSKTTTGTATSYKEIFDNEMANQMQLYAQITELNDKKNEQSSYLSLAKGVSEMV